MNSQPQQKTQNSHNADQSGDPANQPRGVFIVFEGGEGSGKSTQAAILAEKRSALLTRQPGGTQIGASIRELLLHNSDEPVGMRAEALLMAADRAHHVQYMIEPALRSGRDVICDRFMGSSIAYQGGGREMDLEEVAQLSRFAIAETEADLTILLDVPVEVGMARVGETKDKLESLGVAFHQRVRDTYLKLAQEQPNWVVIDGTLEKDSVTEQILSQISQHLD